MKWLGDKLKDDIADAVLRDLDYSPGRRKVFLGNMLREYRVTLAVDTTGEDVQISLDLNKLNETGKLIDGTLPLLLWLEAAARFLRPFPDSSRLIAEAQDSILSRTSGSAVSGDMKPPDAAVVAAVVQEKIIQQNDMVSYAFLEGGWKAGSGIARMKVPRHENGVLKELSPGEPLLFLGTGWLLTPELVMTNHHVINARESWEPAATEADLQLQALGTVAEFDYNSEYVQGVVRKVGKLELADAGLDFAILRFVEAIDRRPPLLLADKVQLDGEPQVVNIIQHPFGKAKKVALRNNHLYDATYPKLRYFTDTEGGSSGSAVFNDNWQVIGLHRAATLVKDIRYQGKTTAWVNEGVQLHAILELISERAPGLAAEIVG